MSAWSLGLAVVGVLAHGLRLFSHGLPTQAAGAPWAIATRLASPLPALAAPCVAACATGPGAAPPRAGEAAR
jgi:hypothetical protein